MLERSTEKFLSSKKMKQLLGKDIPYVPILFEGLATLDMDFNTFIKKSKFSSAELAEGVYIRFESDDYVLERCKFRRKDFKAGR
jgi:hypothetical protein